MGYTGCGIGCCKILDTNHIFPLFLVWHIWSTFKEEFTKYLYFLYIDFHNVHNKNLKYVSFWSPDYRLMTTKYKYL